MKYDVSAINEQYSPQISSTCPCRIDVPKLTYKGHTVNQVNFDSLGNCENQSNMHS